MQHGILIIDVCRAIWLVLKCNMIFWILIQVKQFDWSSNYKYYISDDYSRKFTHTYIHNWDKAGYSVCNDFIDLQLNHTCHFMFVVLPYRKKCWGPIKLFYLYQYSEYHVAFENLGLKKITQITDTLRFNVKCFQYIWNHNLCYNL
jgi:hypothetical protein